MKLLEWLGPICRDWMDCYLWQTYNNSTAESGANKWRHSFDFEENFVKSSNFELKQLRLSKRKNFPMDNIPMMKWWTFLENLQQKRLTRKYCVVFLLRKITAKRISISWRPWYSSFCLFSIITMFISKLHLFSLEPQLLHKMHKNVRWDAQLHI